MRAKKEKARTVNDLLDRFESEVAPQLKPRTWKGYAIHFKTLRRDFGTRIASELVPADFDSLMNVSKGKFHRNKMISCLSSVLSRAVRDWRWLDHNVCSAVSRHKAKVQRREVTDEALDALRSFATPSVRNVVDLALLTAQLQSSIVGLKWSQIVPPVIRFRNPITGESIRVPLTSEIQAVLDRCKQRSGKSPYVITTKSGERYTNEGFRALWQVMCEALEERGHNRFTFNDIRIKARELNAAAQFGQSSSTSAAAIYPEFGEMLRAEAERMSKYYELFYCLEQAIRRFIISTMHRAHGEAWWSAPRVPQDIVDYAAKQISNERESGITPRSSNPIDYTSFGQLSGIIVANWNLFEQFLKSATKGGVLKVMSNLNLLRGPIAHCCPMSTDEMARLHVFVKDWLRMAA